MSVAFGIALESDQWMQSLPENCASQDLAIRGVWETLEAIATEKGLTKLSHFIVEEPDYYEEALEALEEFDDPEVEENRQGFQAKLQAIATQPQWFSAADAEIAATTMRGLIEDLRDNPNRFAPLFDQLLDAAIAAICGDLERFALFLDQIQSQNIGFRFWME